jgi:hypothetical protein
VSGWEQWFGAAAAEVVGVPLDGSHLGVRAQGSSASVWIARLFTRDARELRLTVELPLALAIVDAALGDTRGPGRRVRPLGEIEHGLLLAHCAGLLARISAREPALHLSIAADPPRAARLIPGVETHHRFHVVCGDVAGDVAVYGRPEDLPGPAVVVVETVPCPGDVLLGAGLGPPRPAYPAYVLDPEAWVAQWVQTSQGPGLRVLGRS